MAMQDNLKQVVNSIISEDDKTAKEAFSKYIVAKASKMLKEAKEKSPFRLDGEDLYVNDKKVGTVKNELEDEGKLHYVSNDGKKKKFDKMADLYAHVGKECGLTECKDYEKEIQNMDNHGPDLEKETPFENGKDEGAKGDAADAKLKKKPKKLIADINAGKRPTRD